MSMSVLVDVDVGCGNAKSEKSNRTLKLIELNSPINNNNTPLTRLLEASPSGITFTCGVTFMRGVTFTREVTFTLDLVDYAVPDSLAFNKRKSAGC